MCSLYIPITRDNSPRLRCSLQPWVVINTVRTRNVACAQIMVHIRSISDRGRTQHSLTHSLTHSLNRQSSAVRYITSHPRVGPENCWRNISTRSGRDCEVGASDECAQHLFGCNLLPTKSRKNRFDALTVVKQLHTK